MRRSVEILPLIKHRKIRTWSKCEICGEEVKNEFMWIAYNQGYDYDGHNCTFPICFCEKCMPEKSRVQDYIARSKHRFKYKKYTIIKDS